MNPSKKKRVSYLDKNVMIASFSLLTFNIVVFLLLIVPFSDLSAFELFLTLEFFGLTLLYLIHEYYFSKKAEMIVHYSNHERKRHFQVLQALLYVENYEEAKSYINNIKD